MEVTLFLKNPGFVVFLLFFLFMFWFFWLGALLHEDLFFCLMVFLVFFWFAALLPDDLVFVSSSIRPCFSFGFFRLSPCFGLGGRGPGKGAPHC